MARRFPHTRAYARLLLAGACACMLAIAASAQPGAAASGNTVVSAIIPSATQLASTCQGVGSGGALPFGNVLPDSPALTAPCTITFGSSNDSAALRVYQADGGGTAMYRFADGTLDASFGTSGSVTLAFAGVQQIFGASMQRDGKLIAVGTNGTNALVMRTDTTGALDPTFDGDGIAVVTLPAGGAALEGMQDSQGRIVIGARSNDSSVMYAARLLANGAIDTSFDGDGIAAVDASAGGDFLESMTLLPDDRVVIAGCTTTGSGCNNGVAVVIARLDVNGRPDTTFGTNGVVVEDLDVGKDAVEDVVVDASGRAYVTGELGAQSFVARYSAAGVRDTAGFGSPNGYLRWDAIGGTDNSTALALQSDGRILVTGGNATAVFTDRLTTAGALDPTWASADITLPTGGTPEGTLVLGDGTLMATGFVGAWPGTDQWAAKWTANGAVDTTFTGDGSDVQSRAGGVLVDNGGKLVPWRDGRVAMVGFADPGATNYDLTITMYDDGGSVSDYADTVTDWNTASTTSMFGVCLQSTTATNAWPTTGSCPMSDGTNWRALPLNALDANAKAAYTAGASPPGGETAVFRFGLRPSSTQPAGNYWVETNFEVTAPNA